MAIGESAKESGRNIAEGFARFKHKEFAQFVRVAKGSEAEVLNHFIDALDQRLLTKDEFLMSEHLCKRALKAANGLIRHLESTPDPPTPRWKPKPKPGEVP
jgi:four helix bundle protein